MSTNEKNSRIKILQATWRLLEDNANKRISMTQIASASGVSRQAIYLHFKSRADLFIATTRYVDEIKGLDQRLEKVLKCCDGTLMLDTFVDVWCNYIPEVYAVSKALMTSKESDEAAAAAWTEIMGCLHDICLEIIQRLAQENKLNAKWDVSRAADILYAVISIPNWEVLTIECDWKNEEYIINIKNLINNCLLNSNDKL